MAGLIADQPVLGRDADRGGPYKITGTTLRSGVAESQRVTLYTRYDNVCLGKRVSDSAGTFMFNDIAYIDEGYLVVAQSFVAGNAAVNDRVTPEAM